MKNILIVVIDLGELKAYRLEKTRFNTPHLEMVEDLQVSEAHDKLIDILTDQAGRYRVPNSKMAMSSGERQKIALEFRKRLARHQAEALHHLLENPEIDECYLAASKEIIHPILEELEPRLRAKISKNIPADLTKIDKAEVLEHFLKEPAMAA